MLRRLGYDMRVSMHPGQYTGLSSPDPRIVEAARADLVSQAGPTADETLPFRVRDALGIAG